MSRDDQTRHIGEVMTMLRGASLTIAAGALASLALPPAHLLFFGLLLSWPAYRLTQCSHWRQAFMAGWLTGVGWFAASLYWLANALITGGPIFYWMIPFAVLVVPMGLALFWGAAFVAAWRTTQIAGGRLVALVFFWMLAEWVRGFIFTGFPWQSPGMALAFESMGFGLASLIGLWGCGLVALMAAIIPAAMKIKSRTALLAAAAFVLVASLAGIIAERPMTPSPVTGMTVRLVQPNIPQEKKWQASHFENHLDLYVRASMADADSENPPDLIVWGEAAFAGFLETELDDWQETIMAATRGKSQLLTGSLRSSGEGKIHNSAFLLSPDARIKANYDKLALVPWGEYIPARRFLPFVERLAGMTDIAPGKNYRQLTTEYQNRKVKIAPLICYEVIFPRTTRLAASGADIMVNLTNDAWFGNSLGPRQHLAMAQMRAAELGLPLIRVANTGISAAIDSHGRIVTAIGYDQAGWADAKIGGQVNTIYRRIGDTGFALMMLAALTLAFLSSRTRS